MENNWGYLESGQIVQIDSILRIDGRFFEVVEFCKRPNKMSYGKVVSDFTIVAREIGHLNEIEYHNSELEELIEDKKLKIYNS